MSNPNQILEEQINYYRARAGEYDEWFYRIGRYDYGPEVNRIWFQEAAAMQADLLALGPVDQTLELASGTGIWTRELLKISQRVTAIDAAPEMIALNTQKLGAQAARVEYRQQDLFSWEPDTQFDLVAFCFWLSHVPPEALDGFLLKVVRALRPGGKLFIADSRPEQTSTARDQKPISEPGYSLRRLNTGATFRIVKIYYEPDALREKLRAFGIDAEVYTTGQHYIVAKGTRKAG